MTTATAIGVLSRAYLRITNKKTYDLRDFEIITGNNFAFKVFHLLTFMNPYSHLLEDREKEAQNFLNQENKKHNNSFLFKFETFKDYKENIFSLMQLNK